MTQQEQQAEHAKQLDGRQRQVAELGEQVASLTAFSERQRSALITQREAIQQLEVQLEAARNAGQT